MLMINKSKKPKIAILTIKNSYSYGGVFSTLVAAHDFCQQYFQPTVFFLSFDPTLSTSLKHGKFSSSTQSFSFLGMNCREIGARWAFWEPGHYRYTRDAWNKELSEFDYFFVVSGTCIAAHPLQLLNKKFVMWVGTPYHADRDQRIKGLNPLRKAINFFAEKKMGKIEKNIATTASHIWAISSYTQQYFLNISKKNTHDVTICRHPVDDCATDDSLRKKDPLMLLAVGRFCDPRKNIAMLLRVFEKVHQHKPETELYVVGLTPEQQDLAPYSAQPFFKNIHFTGQVTNKKRTKLYSQAYISIITSYQEGLGIVGIESLAHGTPVVATDCGGTKDYVIDNMTGFLVPINDDNCMAAKIVQLLTNKTLHQKLSQQGKDFVNQHYSINAAHRQFIRGLKKTYPELAPLFNPTTEKSKKESAKQVCL